MFGAFLKGKAINISTKHHSMNNSIPLFTEIQFSVKHLTKKKKLSTTQHMWKDRGFYSFRPIFLYQSPNTLVISPHIRFAPYLFCPTPISSSTRFAPIRFAPYSCQPIPVSPASIISPHTRFAQYPIHLTTVSLHNRFTPHPFRLLLRDEKFANSNLWEYLVKVIGSELKY